MPPEELAPVVVTQAAVAASDGLVRGGRSSGVGQGRADAPSSLKPDATVLPRWWSGASIARRAGSESEAVQSKTSKHWSLPVAAENGW